MPKYDVSGISDWPEEQGQEFAIFCGKEFSSEEEARVAAHAAYSSDLEVIVRPATSGLETSPERPISGDL